MTWGNGLQKVCSLNWYNTNLFLIIFRLNDCLLVNLVEITPIRQTVLIVKMCLVKNQLTIPSNRQIFAHIITMCQVSSPICIKISPLPLDFYMHKGTYELEYFDNVWMNFTGFLDFLYARVRFEIFFKTLE